jgi:pilus assembly protein Flp/PilA
MRGAFVLLQNLVARSLCRDERGATAVEYALILIFIALVIIAGLTLTGTKLNAVFHKVATQI